MNVTISAIGVVVAALLGIVLGAFFVRGPAAGDFHAIVEENGTVVLCLAKGQIMFADRCTGSGRLTIIQSIKEGPIVWSTAVGKIELENESPQNPACALSRAKWDQKTESAIPSGKQIGKLDPGTISTTNFPTPTDLKSGNLRGFQLDLDNDGFDEAIFAFENVKAAVDRYEKSGTTSPYLVIGGIVPADPQNPWPRIFYIESGTYQGGTDTIGDVRLKGVVQIAPEEIALLVQSGSGFNALQDIIRYRGQTQKIETIQRQCD